MKNQYIKRNFSLIELLVIISIILILFSLLSPSLNKIVEFSRQTACQTNLKSFSNAFSMYSEDFSNWSPVVANLIWKYEVRDYLDIEYESARYFRNKSSKGTIFQCPSYDYQDEKAWALYGGYGSNYIHLGAHSRARVNVNGLSKLNETIVLGDGMNYLKDSIRYHVLYTPSWIPWHDRNGYGYFEYTRHQDRGLNIMWLDGHVSYEDWLLISQGQNGDVDYYYRKK